MSQDHFTKLARGEPCYVQVVPCAAPDTVVFAHLRMIGISGIGLKAPSVLGCPACHNCHDAVDRRRYMRLERDFVRLAHLEGSVRWMNELIERGEVDL